MTSFTPSSSPGVGTAVKDGKVLADDGTLYGTVQAAEDAATDWIFIGAGTFSESVVVDTAGLAVVGAGPYATIISSSTSDHAIEVQADDVEIRNLAAENTSSGGAGYGIGVTSGAGTSIENVRIPASDSNGIAFQGGGNATLVNARVDAAAVDMDAVYVGSDNNLVDDVHGTVTDNGTGNTVGETV